MLLAVLATQVMSLRSNPSKWFGFTVKSLGLGAIAAGALMMVSGWVLDADAEDEALNVTVASAGAYAWLLGAIAPTLVRSCPSCLSAGLQLL